MFTGIKIILKSIFSAIGFCCKIVYQILKWLHVRLLALYLAVCGIIQLAFHAFSGKAYVFWIGVAVCGLVTLLSWAIYFRRKFERKNVKREKPKPAKEEIEEETEETADAPEEEKEAERVKYYDVAGKPNYVFAEFGDRYELYRKGQRGLTLVRTDYKKL